MASNITTKGFLWKTLEQYGVMGIQFILQMFLARILAPEVFGVVAIVLVFISLSNVFIQKGFATALVQRKDITSEEISSVFYCSLLIAGFFYSLIFFCAPYISRFFNMPELVGLLRIMCISLFPGVYSSIQNALLRRDINFKVVFFASTISVAISGSVAIWMAVHGFGVWALAAQQLLYSFLVVIVQYYQCRWKPILHFSLSKVKSFWAFGWKILLTGLVNELFIEARTFIIGKMYMPSDLSFYNRGRQFPNLLMNSINGSLQAVLLPRFSSMQDNKGMMSILLRKSITTSYFVMLPLLVLLACCAEPLIDVLLTEKWLPCVPYLQLYCFYYVAWPFCTSSIQAIYAVGRSDIIMKIEIFRKILDCIALLISIYYGVLWIAAGAVLVEVVTMALYVLPVRKLIGFSLNNQIKELLPTIVMSVIIGLIILSISMIPFNSIIILLLQIIIGTFVYMILSFWFQKSLSLELVGKVKNLKNS